MSEPSDHFSASSESCVPAAPARLQRGYTLIEFIGALAIIAILAAVLAPVIIRRIDLAAWTAERNTLNAMSEALTQHILRSNNIPNAATWAEAIGSELALAQTNITLTPRRFGRVFLIDSGGWLGSALATGPWNQNPGGLAAAPTNARVMIVSTLSRGLPSTVNSGMMAGTEFNDIWNTPQGSKPNNVTWNTWAGKGDDLLIQRVNLQPLFHRVVLINSFVGGQGYFSINNSTPALVPVGGMGTNAYFLDGTVLGLHDTNQVLVAREIIRDDTSRVFEYGLWRDQINLGMIPPTPSSLGMLAAAFLASTNPPVAGGGGSAKWNPTPKGAADSLCAFMFSYAAWANQSPCFSFYGTGSSKNAPQSVLFDAAFQCFNTANGGGTLVPQ